MGGARMKRCVERLPLKSPTLPPATTTNCLLLGSEDYAIVDPASPWVEEQERLLSVIEERRSQGIRPACIALTHHHHDHVGGVMALKRSTGLPVLAHPRTAELLSGTVEVDGFLDEGDRLQTGPQRWHVLHTPGHATGHICFFLPDTGEGVVGDMLAGEGTIVLDPPEGNLSDYLRSLRRLLTLNAQCLYPAHGPALEDPRGILEHYIRHRLARTEQVASEGRKRSSFTPEELVPEIYSEIPQKFWPIATRQVLCHLLFLADQGDFVQGQDGRFESPGVRHG